MKKRINTCISCNRELKDHDKNQALGCINKIVKGVG